MKKNTALWWGTAAMLLAAWGGPARAQSAGDTLVSVGGAWLDFGLSSSGALSSSSAYGTFTSPGVHAQVHNALTAELRITRFLTDHVALEAAAGWPPTISIFAQGNAQPLGAGGVQLPLGTMQPLASARAWPLDILLKYYFLAPDARVRPFVGLGVNYTWYSGITLNPAFASIAQAYAGQGGSVRASLSPSWNPLFSAGVSWAINHNWYATGLLTYVPLSATISTRSVTAAGNESLANRLRIHGNPLVVSLGVGYRF